MFYQAKPFLHLLRCCVALSSLTFAVHAHAGCAIREEAMTANVAQVMDENGAYTFKNYASVCDKLNGANARIAISGEYGVLQNRAYAWVSIQVGDKDNRYLKTPYSAKQSTWLSNDASTPKARELLWKAINDALGNWEGLDEALDALEQARKSLQPAPQR